MVGGGCSGQVGPTCWLVGQSDHCCIAFLFLLWYLITSVVKGTKTGCVHAYVVVGLYTYLIILGPLSFVNYHKE